MGKVNNHVVLKKLFFLLTAKVGKKRSNQHFVLFPQCCIQTAVYVLHRKIMFSILSGLNFCPWRCYYLSL